jgi:hypothetical protein
MRIRNRLPNGDLAVVDDRKITDYLLASDHPAGQAKAALFRRFGFSPIAGQVLREALLSHARTARVFSVIRNSVRSEVYY